MLHCGRKGSKAGAAEEHGLGAGLDGEGASGEAARSEGVFNVVLCPVLQTD